MEVSEAKTKVCPFMVDYTFEANDCIATRYRNCIGNECMAWEWENKSDGKGGDFIATMANYDCKSTTDGYCKRIDK